MLPWIATAQNGDKAGETQAPLPAHLQLPPSPPLGPQDALASFKLPPEFKIELVASEPLIGDPVAMQFDTEGRIWVVEMRGYMPNIEGTHETEPVGRIVVLEDTDNDGQMDKSTVFLDQLVMPRALSLINGGVVIAEPPRLWFCKDLDGDLKCDRQVEIAGDYATQNDPKHGLRSNPEHASNGLMWGMDNWIYSANHTVQFRYEWGQWKRAETHSRGQWGITQDNFGRIFYNSNSDQLRGDLIPAAYLRRNKHYRGAAGASVRLARDQTVWPSRINPGVNRGYRKQTLREDGTLARYTGACGPVIYRGNQFPSEFVGNAFICEPTGNFVRRNILTESAGILEASNAYAQMEFLTSSDERFRPVNAYNGPDGALYLVDFYRGLIQHRLYLTSFLRKQIEDRGLYEPIGLGRIYRVVYKGKDIQPGPKMAQMSSNQLVEQLSNSNGWHRSTAQRLLVERNDPATMSQLQLMASSGRKPLARLHALWTLDGMGGAPWPVIRDALSASHPKVRSAALRLSEPYLNSSMGPLVLETILSHQFDLPEVQMQLALTLGMSDAPEALTSLASILTRHVDHPYIRSAVFSGIQGKESRLLNTILKGSPWWAQQKPKAAEDIYTELARCIFRSRNAEAIRSALEVTASTDERTSRALLKGFREAAFKRSQGAWIPDGTPINLETPIQALDTLSEASDSIIAELATALQGAFDWPGRDAPVDRGPAVVALTESQQELFDMGRDLYQISCGACHQPHGMGQDGLAPPLKDSDWTTGSKERMIRIALHGLQGPIEVHGKQWELIMPGLAVFEDQQLASILTYVRRSWGHTASPVESSEVTAIRAQHPDREDMWTVKELLQIK
jgi:putative membrane-bound dehydrogenase-like protein